jgi:protein O-mannosyl-transferase
VAMLLTVLALVAYAPALQARYIWDDEAYVTGNETLRTLGGITSIWLDPVATPQYYPLVHTTYWLEYRLWGLAPAGYHAVNILLHAANGVLVFVLLRRLRLPGALFAAALFTLHPVHVESVAWITERKNVLSGFFYLAAMLACLRFRPPGANDPSEAARPAAHPASMRTSYGIALLLFLCALLSKTVTASLPAAFLLLIWWKEGRVTRRDVLLFAPFFVLGALAGSSTAWLEKNRVGAYGADWDLSAADRLLIAGRAVWFYLGKLAWPHPLIFIYPRWAPDPRSVAQWMFPLAAAGLLAALWTTRRRLGRGPLTAALFFGGTLVPALGFFDIYPMRYSFVADHFQYLASLGVLALFAAAATSRREWRPAFAGGLLLVLGALTFRQARHYHDYETLWLDTLAKNPQCWMASNNLGLIYEKQGRLDAAIAQYSRALEAKPDSEDAHTNLGNALLLAGRRDEALPHLREAVRLAPDSGEAWNNLGGGWSELGNIDEAIACYRKAAQLSSDDERMHLNLGHALAARGDLDEAIRELAAADGGVEPPYRGPLGAAHFNLGNALFQKGRLAEAEQQYRRALQWNPEDADARINLGYVLVRTGRGEQARPLFREALARDPGSARAAAGLAMIGAQPQ